MGGAGEGRGGVLILLADDFIDVWWLDIVMEEQEGGLGAREYHRDSTQYLFIVYYCNVVCIPVTATGVRSDNLK